jgi:hypothetical protein
VNGLKGVTETEDITTSETHPISLQDGKWNKKIFVFSTALEIQEMENNTFFGIKAAVILTH